MIAKCSSVINLNFKIKKKKKKEQDMIFFYV